MSTAQHPALGEASARVSPPALPLPLPTELKLTAAGRASLGPSPARKQSPGAMARWWDPSLSVLWVLRPKLWESGPHGVTAGLQVAPFDWQVPSLVACLVQYSSACEPIFSTLHGGFNSSVDQVVGWLGETQGLENGPSHSGSQLPSRAVP